MKHLRKTLIAGPIFLLSALILSGCNLKSAVLNPQGPVAQAQYDLIMYSVWFMLAIVIVVSALFTIMVVKYREKPENKDYEPPDQHGSTLLEIIWTAIPVVIIIALLIPTIKVIYQLEEIPEGYEDVEPITINVTSAEWKWIFSYPEQGIETVNYVNIPEDTPIKFQLTSAGTMGAFWVPELGGQKYTMPGHDMELILLAENPGSYIGRNANFNGEGFTHMDFEVLSQSHSEFEQWVNEVKQTAPSLTKEDYETILEEGLVGRMTFTGTHLEWVEQHHSEHEANTDENHADHGDSEHEEEEHGNHH